MTESNSKEWLFLKRTVRFGDTDAAGVIHFLQLLRWCHEAWEESLHKYGISAASVFPNKTMPEISFPIVHCEADYFKPIYVGDTLQLELIPEKIDLCSFSLEIKFYRENINVAYGMLRHLAINSKNRKRSNLTKPIDLWLEASTLSLETNR